MAEREYRGYAQSGGGRHRGDPDVLLDVPVLKVDSIHFELETSTLMSRSRRRCWIS